MNTVYIGYDSREPVAYDVAKFSIESRAKIPVNIVPLKINELSHLLTRPVEWRGTQMWCPISDAPQGTEFSISRFLIPFLQEEGWALFMDCDMVLRSDINELFDLAMDKFAAMCVKHSYEPKDEIHMVDQIQTKYPRKNWASLMLINCSHPSNKRLSLQDVNTWPGRDLHALKWLWDSEIGYLPMSWNFLVDVNEGNLEEQNLLHYTLGGSWLSGWEKKESDKYWDEEYALMKSS